MAGEIFVQALFGHLLRRLPLPIVGGDDREHGQAEPNTGEDY
ncbi:hypothetical protein JCM19233_6622 [Vibrio astriarenae]|nr:hypothetical protein JCM19233_6622 [Vibrio sp. C7]